MCAPNWGGKDEFEDFNDCHIWLPMYTIFNTLLLVHAIFNFVVSGYRMYLARLVFKHAIIPGIVFFSAALTILATAIRLGLNVTAVNSNVAANFFTGISRGGLWTTFFIFQGRMIEVVFYVQFRLSGKQIEGVLFLYRVLGVYFMSTLAVVWELVTFLGPIIAPQSIHYRIAFFSHVTTSTTLGLILHVVFAVRVRRIISDMSLSNALYTQVKQKLDFLVFNAACFGSWSIPLSVISMLVPAVMRYNSIVFFLIWLCSINIVLVVLFGAVPVDSNIENNKADTKLSAATNSAEKE
jgi:hypothetical protein